MFSESQAAATIASGGSLSSAVNLMGGRLFALQMPASWTAANLTFQGATGSTFADVYDESGTEVSIVAAASRYILIDPAKFIGLRNIKIRSGTSGTPVNQGADRVIQVITIS